MKFLMKLQQELGAAGLWMWPHGIENWDSNTQESTANINNSSVHCAKRHDCEDVLNCFNNKKDAAHYRNTGG